jgi:DNA-binding CsgD family transcriptional regulator
LNAVVSLRSCPRLLCEDSRKEMGNESIEGDRLRNPTQNDVAGLGRARNVDVSLGDPDLKAWICALSLLPVAPVAETDILAWVEGPLRQFFPFKRFLGGYGSLSGGRIEMRSLVTSGHTPEFLSGLESKFDVRSHGCFAWWVSNRKAFILDKRGAMDATGLAILATRRELEEIVRFSLGVVAAHGFIDPFVKAGTYISFSGVPRTQRKRTLAALDLIAPVLHSLFLQTKQPTISPIDLTALTDRQREMVDLALAGLSDKAIAVRLAISDHTVGNHLRAIFARLGISKRSQLIALLK